MAVNAFSFRVAHIQVLSAEDEACRLPITARKGAPSPFAVCCCPSLSASTTSQWRKPSLSLKLGVGDDGEQKGKYSPERGMLTAQLPRSSGPQQAKTAFA